LVLHISGNKKAGDSKAAISVEKGFILKLYQCFQALKMTF